MTDYVKNIDVLFANKRCVELLDEARRLIMSDIHNVVEVNDLFWVQVTYFIDFRVVFCILN